VNFLCAVSGRFPENYEIGLRARCWGVEEQYEQKIRRTSKGDLLVFSVGGEFRSIHRIESGVYHDDSRLWPEKDGSRFPFRVRMTEPLYRGTVPVRDAVPQISFMKDKKRWTGTIQGPHGVFNPHLTDEDVELLRSRMRRVRHEVVQAPRDVEEKTSRIPVRVFRSQLEDGLADLLSELDLVEEEAAGRSFHQDPPGEAAFTMLARRRDARGLVVLALDTGGNSSALLLEVLREMSELRKHQAHGKDVAGMILTDAPRDELLPAVREIPNLELRRYRMRFELDPEPDSATNGWSAA
jgi:hypothetical protein